MPQVDEFMAGFPRIDLVEARGGERSDVLPPGSAASGWVSVTHAGTWVCSLPAGFSPDSRASPVPSPSLL